MKTLKLSNDLSLPLDAVTQTIAAIGRKGSGKTYGSGKLAELLIDAGVQVAILDTVGNWFGLRLSGDGKSSGIDIPIIGGLRGDIPLEPTAGALIADVVTESGRSIVIDLSQFSKSDRQRFAAAFGEKLWKNKKAERNPTPVHLIIEEAQVIVPQMVRPEQAHMVGVFEEIIRLGRNYGIGITMITQRPQSVNKEVLNQTELLLVFQTNGAQERKALREWIVHQGMNTDILNELPSLKPGECFVWSPQWLGTFQKIKILPKRTFDSSETPKVGAGTFRGKDPKPIDLEQIKAKMAATIEKAKAENPRELRKQIAELKKELQKKETRTEVKTETQIERVEVPILKDSQITRIEKLYERVIAEAERHGKAMAMFWKNQDEVATSLLNAMRVVANVKHEARQKPVISLPPAGNKITPKIQKPLETNGNISGPSQRILNALAWMESIGVIEPEATAVAFLAGYTIGGGAFNNPRGWLNQRGYIQYLSDNRLTLTDQGRAVAEYPTQSLTTEELQSRVLDRLPGPERKILNELIKEYPEDISYEELAGRSGYTQGGGAFNNPRGRLRSLGLIEYTGSGRARARSILFLE